MSYEFPNEAVESTLLIWDLEGDPPKSHNLIVLWQQFGTSNNSRQISIPEIIEHHPELLRKKFLQWIYEFGTSYINGKSLIERLLISKSLSYWWMLGISEKCNFSKSPEINDAIRMLAFENFVMTKSVKKVIFKSENTALENCIGLFCSQKGIIFEKSKPSMIRNNYLFFKRIFYPSILILKGFIWLLKYWIERKPLIGLGVEDWKNTNGRLTFFSYSDNSSISLEDKYPFKSNYWSSLPRYFVDKKININWLHLYSKDENYTDCNQAKNAFKLLNNASSNTDCHVFLDSFLTINILFKTLLSWIRIFPSGISLAKKISSIDKSPLDFWPIFEKGWFKSFCGPIALNNLLNLHLFRSALAILPKQELGVYLQENQAWEFALLDSWRGANHDEIIGFPHSTVRFWDLRYYYDPRIYRESSPYTMPRPNKVAINGGVAYDSYQSGGYPVEDLVRVEALRYLDLSRVESGQGTVLNPQLKNLRILVLGDYLKSNNEFLIEMLRDSVLKISFDVEIIFKAHPNCPVDISSYDAMNIRIASGSLEDLLAKCDVAYASPITSAVVDAYLAGIKVIAVLDPKILNLSPLRGFVDVSFVRSSDELTNVLTQVKANPIRKLARDDYFFLDKKLPMWLKLLRS